MSRSNRWAPRLKLPLHRQFADYMAGEKVYPVNLEISPSGVCQASCNFCWYANTGELGGHRNVFLETERLFQLIDEAALLGVKSISWTGGGDPSLHVDIDRLTNYAFLRCFRQGMFTNALSEPKYDPLQLDWIRVTVTDRPMRLDYLKMLRTCPTLGIAFNYAGPQDDDLLRTVLHIAELVDADYVQVRPALAFHGRTVDIKPPPFDHPLMAVTGYKFEDARKPHGYATCEGYHFVPFLWEDGNLDVCGYMRKHEGYTLGNIYEDSLRTILDRAPPSVPVHANCQVCCKNHEINKLIHQSRDVKNRDFP